MEFPQSFFKRKLVRRKKFIWAEKILIRCRVKCWYDSAYLFNKNPILSKYLETHENILNKMSVLGNWWLSKRTKYFYSNTVSDNCLKFNASTKFNRTLISKKAKSFKITYILIYFQKKFHLISVKLWDKMPRRTIWLFIVLWIRNFLSHSMCFMRFHKDKLFQNFGI